MTIDEKTIRQLVVRALEETRTEPAAHDAAAAVPTTGPGVRLAIGADHGGFGLKQSLIPWLEAQGHTVLDCGTHDEQSVDYPDFAHKVARQVATGGCTYGIVVDGAGIGSAMVANKVPGVRAALCYDLSSARNSREHNLANVLTLGAGLIGSGLARQIVSTWLETPWGGDRHARRIGLLHDVEQRYLRRNA